MRAIESFLALLTTHQPRCEHHETRSYQQEITVTERGFLYGNTDLIMSNLGACTLNTDTG